MTLLVPDTFDVSQINEHISDPSGDNFELLRHDGYDSYAEQCYALAPKMDAAVMAAAVVNWIPAEPIKGKMKTEGFNEGDIQNIPFKLAPRVIDRMRKLNGKLTLIGCKMTSGAEPDETYRQAYGTLLKAHCNVVVANDLQRLKEKTLVFPDGNRVVMDGFPRMYEELERVLRDRHYRTEASSISIEQLSENKLNGARAEFDTLCDTYREKFKKRPEGPYGPERVFGSVAVRIDNTRYLVSPREKGTMFDSKEAVIVTAVDREKLIVHTIDGKKATLNAPLLIRVMETQPVNSVVHLHEEQPDWPTLHYAPPGTVRDNDRTDAHTTFLPRKFNIRGHGCVFAPWK